MSQTIDAYLETGLKRTFAAALAWPGWCRSGRDETDALQTLNAYGPRYARVAQLAALDFPLPAGTSAFAVVERLPGGSGTDFGAPGAIPAYDQGAADEAELARLHALLRACWHVLDEAAAAAEGRELRTGPRGGGRARDDIVAHVLDAEAGYLSRVAYSLKPIAGETPAERMARTREAVLAGLDAAAHGEVPAAGPRGGVRWPARYFARRVAWHILDYAWEIEDRILPE